MFWSKTSQLESERKSFVVVTMVSSRGHAPQDPGAKAIITSEGLQFGTVGGGKIEARAIEHAKKRLQNIDAGKAPELLTWNLTTDIGMTCGGEVTLLFESVLFQSWPIVIFGAGHIAQALTRVLCHLDCEVTCIDSRPEWLEKLPSGSNLKKIQLERPLDAVQQLSSDSFFVVMTQGHATDLPILTEIFRRFKKPKYVGAIGSDVKAMKLKNDLLKSDISPEQLEEFKSPIGLDIGTNHPYEIAISIAAQLIQVRDKTRA